MSSTAVLAVTDHLTEIATGDGLAPLLVLIGTLLIIFSISVFGALTLGAIGSLFTSE